MSGKIQLALEGESLKAAQETPGAFPLSQPYGMADRVRRALGISGKQSKGLPGMVGTVGTGVTTGTASGIPKGMGKVEQPSQPASSASLVSKMGQAGPLGTPPSMKPLLGGMKPVRPKMEISQKPQMDKVTLASAYPGRGDVLSALGYGAEMEVAAMLTKEGSQQRILRVIEAVDELERATTADGKIPVLLKLASLRQEAISASALRMSLL